MKTELALVVTLAEHCTAYLPNVPLGSFTNLLCIFYLSNLMAHRPVTHIMSMHGVLLEEHLSRHSRHSSVIMCESLDHIVYRVCTVSCSVELQLPECAIFHQYYVVVLLRNLIGS